MFRTKLVLGGGVLDGCDSVEKSGKPYRIAVVRPSGTYSVTVEKLKPPVGGSVSARGSKTIEVWDDAGAVDWDKLKDSR